MIAYLDCASGISGDKFLAACIDAGAPIDLVRSAVAAVAPGVAIMCERVSRGGITGTALHIEAAASETPSPRTWRGIRELLEVAPLAPRVRGLSLQAFGLLAEAEARVHGVDVERVHFHEIGAIDSIADIVGSAAAVEALALSMLVCGDVAIGSGTVETSHGLLPIPAPATALLLEGVPVQPGSNPGEATTPTGAALIRTFAHAYGPMPPMVIRSVGHGAGSRDTAPMPNIARLFLGDEVRPQASFEPPREGARFPAETVEPLAVLSTVVDHLSPECLATSVEALIEHGALDVWQTPVYMKKGRLGVEITALALPVDAHRLASFVARQTGTLGVRISPMTRLVAERSHLLVETRLGPVRVKVSGAGEAMRGRVEHDDVAALSRAHNLPPDRVAALLAADVEAALASQDERLDDGASD